MTSAISERLPAAVADRYRIERELGQGGMATVYLAHDLTHDRKVAVKVLKPELAAVLGAGRFVVEIRTTAALQHPHIVPLFDSGTADGFLYYVMPFIDGEALRAKLDRETQLGVDEAVRIAREVADALDYAHRHGVIHRHKSVPPHVAAAVAKSLEPLPADRFASAAAFSTALSDPQFASATSSSRSLARATRYSWGQWIRDPRSMGMVAAAALAAVAWFTANEHSPTRYGPTTLRFAVSSPADSTMVSLSVSPGTPIAEPVDDG